MSVIVGKIAEVLDTKRAIAAVVSAEAGAEAGRLREVITATIAIFDDEQAHADEMVARGLRRGAATAVTQPRAARAMVKLLRSAVTS